MPLEGHEPHSRSCDLIGGNDIRRAARSSV